MKKVKVLIVGAGAAGKELLKQIIKYKNIKYQIAGFVDDNIKTWGKVINQVRVLGDRTQLTKFIKKYKIEKVFIALPSVEGSIISAVFKQCVSVGTTCQIVPRVREIIEGKVDINRVRRVEIEDLLGRPVRKPDIKGIRRLIKNKTILVTGGAGSIGSELCRQIAAYSPKNLVVIDWWENGLYELELEFKQSFPNLNFSAFIGNIQDKARLTHIFDKTKPDLVFHAAAYKHVPLMEKSPTEVVKNNVFGLKNLIDTAKNNKVKQFIFISTDKAVDPKSLMGLTKFIGEQMIKQQKSSSTEFIAVRFGNVLDSFGSVLPLFRKQIANGGPITITNKSMKRYFMTIPEAIQLILKAATIGKQGNVFILDMGKPIKIIDLAKNLILLSGLRPQKDIKIKIIGKRPGEKTSEELVAKNEKIYGTKFKEIMIIKNASIKKIKLGTFLPELLLLCEKNNEREISKLLKKLLIL